MAGVEGHGVGGLLHRPCVLFRVVNAVCVRTFFSADEYWQSLEVAHKLVFGYGHLTWEWTHALINMVAINERIATAANESAGGVAGRASSGAALACSSVPKRGAETTPCAALVGAL